MDDCLDYEKPPESAGVKVSRYAPSPTGPLHLGNLRTALLAWLQARLSGADFILRMEDLDLPRVKAGSAKQIIDDLLWLGLDWDQGPSECAGVDDYYQSQRTDLYQQALLSLYAKGLVYPCYCSRKDIREAASAPHGKLPIYPGTCRNLDNDINPANEQSVNGRMPAWRFKVSDQNIAFTDKLMGEYCQNLQVETGDFVLRRSDGLFAYQLAVVVDDIEMGITDVLRGEDLLDSTCRQIALYQALDAPVPDFWHVGLMQDEQGKRMSKRDDSDSISQLRANGAEAESIISMLAYSCGLLATNQPISAKELLSELSIMKFIFCVQREVS